MSNLWRNGKKERAEQAREHTEKMDKMYENMIKRSVRNTTTYLPGFKCTKIVDNAKIKIIFDNMDSLSAILKYHENVPDEKIAVLNFSSYKKPGGMFINGSKAQEECLCHESFLYNVLSQVTDFYDWNNANRNRALYLNRGLYSPDILFLRDGFQEEFCNVITCAAPNRSAAQKYQNVTDEENTRVLRSRIKFVLDIAKDNGISTLILGAYGCGVFGQDAKEVAEIFKEYLSTTHKCFEKVIFAIPRGRDKNLEEFERVFSI